MSQQQQQYPKHIATANDDVFHNLLKNVHGTVSATASVVHGG